MIIRWMLGVPPRLTTIRCLPGGFICALQNDFGLGCEIAENPTASRRAGDANTRAQLRMGRNREHERGKNGVPVDIETETGTTHLNEQASEDVRVLGRPPRRRRRVWHQKYQLDAVFKPIFGASRDMLAKRPRFCRLVPHDRKIVCGRAAVPKDNHREGDRGGLAPLGVELDIVERVVVPRAFAIEQTEERHPHATTILPVANDKMLPRSSQRARTRGV